MESTLALKHWIGLTKKDMWKMKVFMNSYKISIPSSTNLLKYRSERKLAISPCLDGKGVQVDYEDLIKDTTKSIINMVHPIDLKDGEYLNMIYKDGADGAGGHVVWQSGEMTEAVHHLFQHGLVPL